MENTITTKNDIEENSKTTSSFLAFRRGPSRDVRAAQ